MSQRPTVEDDASLFRAEALNAQRAQQYGEIMLLPGAWSRWMALAAVALVLGAAALVGFGTFTRRATVTGQLAPSEGLIRVTSPQTGVILESPIREGAAVRRGDLLFVISADRAGPDAGAYQQVISRQIEARRQSLEDELRRSRSAEEQETALQTRRAESLKSERDQLSRQEALLAGRVRGSEDAAVRYQSLFKQGYVSRDELLARESELSEARGRLQIQRREALALDRDIATAYRELEAMRSRYAAQRAEVERNILMVRQEFTELEARRRVMVTAPADGQVTLLQANVGQSVEQQRPLAHLLPAGSRLIARLYVPSRAAGFIRPGMTVQLRYDPYPFQKFGQHLGKVLSISAAAVSQEELQGQTLRTETAAETHFAVTVELPSQSLTTTAKQLPLQAGMRLEADLLQETRPLYEWILQPLFVARARMEGS
jgi:membrane fusion protein